MKTFKVISLSQDDWVLLKNYRAVDLKAACTCSREERRDDDAFGFPDEKCDKGCCSIFTVRPSATIGTLRS